MVSINLLHNVSKVKSSKKKVIMNLRQEVLKGGCFLNDIIKLLTVECNNLEIHVINNAGDFSFPINNNSTCDIVIHEGPISKIQMIGLLKESDFLIDTSLSEGFGLLPLEAMAAETIPIISNSFGNNEYCKNEDNCFLINDVNNTQEYVDKLKILLENEKLVAEIKKSAVKTAKNYDFDKEIINFKNELEKIDQGMYSKVEDNIKKKDISIMSNYTLNDFAFNHIINTSVIMFERKNEKEVLNSKKRSNRLHNFKVILKEIIKANVYLFKLTIKTIINKDFRI